MFTKAEIEDILSLYRETKAYILNAETFSDKGSPTLAYELRNSYDHFLRAAQYRIHKQEEKALEALSHSKNHIVRTLFDAIEMHFLNIKSAIIELENNYSFGLLILAMPDYIEKVRTKFEELAIEFKKLKTKKEVEAFVPSQVLEDGKKYLTESIELSDLLKTKLQTLSRLKKEEESRRKKDTTKNILITVIAGAVMTGIGFIMGYFIP
ncbi:MAG: hypothetical protein FWD49_00885 [Firmicutes bacterium]|nr:hypothetical protein [Bacillota bacterium]